MGGGYGACLSAQDLKGLSDAMRDFVVRCFLPRVEERIADLNKAVTANRKGITNRLSRLWGGARGTLGGGAAGGGGGDGATDTPYLWHSIESKMRQLGDLSFLLRNYEFAASVYRLAASDYQSGHNSKWYAGVEVGKPTFRLMTCL